MVSTLPIGRRNDCALLDLLAAPWNAALALREDDLLGALPEEAPPERSQVLAALDDRREMVARERSRLAREADVPVREQELRLADAAGVEDDLARIRVARGVLRCDPEIEVAHRNPAALAAPAHVDDPRLERQQRPEGGDGLRRVRFLEARDEIEAAGRNCEHQGIFAPWRIHAPSDARSAGVMCVRLPSGIVRCTTACCRISSACARISCGVSKAIPFGGAENPGSVGWAEWQTAHR